MSEPQQTSSFAASPASQPAPRRRRWIFNYSLRTLFVVTTLLCVWLGWQSSVVHKRQALRGELKGNMAYQFVPAAELFKRYPGGAPVQKLATVPLTRRLLGDEAIQEVWVYSYMEGFSPAAQKRIAEVFPEAEIRDILPEPCHPGCFPSGTLVETPSGARAIETIAVGDLLLTVEPDGATKPIAVQSIFITTNQLLEVKTDAGTLLTTQTQPLCRTVERIVAAGDLLPGDTIQTWHHQAMQPSVQPRVQPTQVLSVTPTGRGAKVYNLVLGNSEIFIAGGFLARSKPPADGEAHAHHD